MSLRFVVMSDNKVSYVMFRQNNGVLEFVCIGRTLQSSAHADYAVGQDRVEFSQTTIFMKLTVTNAILLCLLQYAQIF